MKDIIITGKIVKRELMTLLCCFIIATGLNVYAIITYDSKWVELITSIFYVLAATVALYVVWAILRLLFVLVKRIMGKPKTNTKSK